MDPMMVDADADDDHDHRDNPPPGDSGGTAAAPATAASEAEAAEDEETHEDRRMQSVVNGDRMPDTVYQQRIGQLGLSQSNVFHVVRSIYERRRDHSLRAPGVDRTVSPSLCTWGRPAAAARPFY